MNRNLKALGLTLIAAFAMSAFVSSVAQANPNPLALTADEYPAVLTGTQINHKLAGGGEQSTHTFSVGGRVLTCTSAIFHGTITAEDNEEITITPTYTGCTASGGFPATVTMEGCDYVFHGGVETEVHHFKEGTVDLVCPPEKNPIIHIYSSKANHEAGTNLCKYKVTTFENKGEITYKNTTGTPDDVDVIATIQNVPVDRVEGSALLCGAAEQLQTYTGASTLRAYQDLGNHEHENGTVTYTEGNQIGLTVSKP